MQKVGFNPLVSIVIPAYNGEKYLKETIENALSQSYDNLEILVIDDGSTDNTPKIAKSFGKKIKYLRKVNGGVATALNFGIENMRGDYFSWLSHDDLYHKDKIMKQIEELSKHHGKTKLITCSYTRVDEFGNFIDDENTQRYKVEIAKYTDKELSTPLFALLVGGCIFGCGLLIHKSHFERVGVFDSSLLTNDYDLWFRMMRNNELIFMRETLAYKRIHKDQDTNTKSEYISAAWFAYFIQAVNNLPDDEFLKIYKSRTYFYNYVRQNIGIKDEELKKIFSAQTRDEKYYLILKEQFINQVVILKNEINSLIYEKNNIKNSISWKITKPLRVVKKIIKVTK